MKLNFDILRLREVLSSFLLSVFVYKRGGTFFQTLAMLRCEINGKKKEKKRKGTLFKSRVSSAGALIGDTVN